MVILVTSAGNKAIDTEDNYSYTYAIQHGHL